MKTYAVIDENNNVIALAKYTKIKIDGYETIELEEELDHKQIEGFVYNRDEHKILFSNERYNFCMNENKKWDLRNKREEECFSIVNRGDIWYKNYVNTPEREDEFNAWYQAWLDVTDTMVEPIKPDWIK